MILMGHYLLSSEEAEGKSVCAQTALAAHCAAVVVLREGDTFVAHPPHSLRPFFAQPDVSSPPFYLSSFLLRQPTFPERIRMSDDNQEWAREGAVIYGQVDSVQHLQFG